jgi:hypothetical protein
LPFFFHLKYNEKVRTDSYLTETMIRERPSLTFLREREREREETQSGRVMRYWNVRELRLREETLIYFAKQKPGPNDNGSAGVQLGPFVF